MFRVGDIVETVNDLFFDGNLIIPRGLKGKITKKIDIDLFQAYFGNCNYLFNAAELKLAESQPPNSTTSDTDYTIKSDQDKPRLSLVPILPLWESIARIREYGVAKYGDNQSWKQVELKRYHDALLRHTAAISTDINAVDEESGMPHR